VITRPSSAMSPALISRFSAVRINHGSPPSGHPVPGACHELL
jgi:hypothetical protein